MSTSTTTSVNEIWSINCLKFDLNISCLPTNGNVIRYFSTIYKNTTKADAVKQLIEMVTET